MDAQLQIPPEREVLISQADRVLTTLCERLGSCLAIEGLMMKSGLLFECGPLPPMFTLRPPDVIHVISVPRPSPFFGSLPFLCGRKPKNTRKAWKQG